MRSIWVGAIVRSSDEGPERTEAPEGPVRRPPAQPQQPVDLVRVGLWFYGGMALVAVAWRAGFYGEPIFFSSLEAELQGVAWVRDSALGLSVGLLVVAISYVLTELTSWGDRLARELARTIGRLSLPDALLMAAASGFSEELLFRGALQPRAGLLLASVLFGAMHFAPRRDMLPWTGFALAIGLIFGWMFEHTGNLVAPMIAHGVVNAVNLPLLVRRYGGESDAEEVEEEPP